MDSNSKRPLENTRKGRTHTSTNSDAQQLRRRPRVDPEPTSTGFVSTAATAVPMQIVPDGPFNPQPEPPTLSMAPAPAVSFESDPMADVIDIDLADAGNPQAATEYVKEIYQYLREIEVREQLQPNYMSLQKDIDEKMRAILVDWLLDIHYDFRMCPDTLFLAVNLMDRFLSKRQVSHKKLQLIGITALFLATKFEETPAIPIQDFVYCTRDSCPAKAILKMEQLLLGTLKFNLSVPTTLTFLKRFAKAANADSTIGMLSRFMTELSLTDYLCSTRFLPSQVAAAAISLALQCAKRPTWTTTLQYYTGYREADLEVCKAQLVRLVQNVPRAEQRAVYEKYSTQRYLQVADLCIHELTRGAGRP